MKKLSARVARANFSGRILERGFWLYVWKVTAPNKTVFYVGRTGDSSSRWISRNPRQRIFCGAKRQDKRRIPIRTQPDSNRLLCGTT